MGKTLLSQTSYDYSLKEVMEWFECGAGLTKPSEVVKKTLSRVGIRVKKQHVAITVSSFVIRRTPAYAEVPMEAAIMVILCKVYAVPDAISLSVRLLPLQINLLADSSSLVWLYDPTSLI
ncbi:hypothetical protein TNCV_2708661 [Trichonephila clavipes]|nr:hypothetical protein TNCV_2708661 [Trichonephila clavipes]